MKPNHLKSLRKAQKLTQQDVAETLQISVSTYHQYESGKRNMRPDTLIAMARFFDVTIDEILGYPLPEQYFRISADQKEILTLYSTLDSQHKRLVRAILQELSPVISMKQNPSLRIANRSSEPVPETDNAEELPGNLENLPDVPEDI